MVVAEVMEVALVNVKERNETEKAKERCNEYGRDS